MDSSVIFARLRQCAPHLTHASLDPPESYNPNNISIGSAVFAQLTAECPYTLQWAAPFPLKIARSPGESGPPSNTPTWVRNPK